MLKEFDISGRNVLITGAGRGIGKGIALVMAEAGANVAVTSAGGETAEEVAGMVRAMGRNALGAAADATRVEPMEALRERVLAELGGVDVLINCLGDAIPGTVAKLPGSERPALVEADWHKVIDLNLTQAYVGCHVFGPHLLAKGKDACVINISSFAAIRPAANMVAYAAGKAGLTRFTESLALEWAPHGVRVNAIAPGFFPDAYTMTDEQWAERIATPAPNVPLNRVGHPREVGYLAVYLASPAASYVTGQTFAIDGGRTLV